MVHESQSFSGAGGITSQTPLLISPDVTIRGASRVFGFALQLGIEGTPATMQTRLRQVSPADMAGFKGSVFPPHMDMGDVDWQTSQPFGRAAVRDYLAQARDSNPIHVDDDAARALGLEAAVVPGMFIAGVAEFMVWHALPDARLEGMKLRFMAPVLVGACLRYGVLVRSKSKQGRPKAVRVFILRRDNVIAAIADLDMQDDR